MRNKIKERDLGSRCTVLGMGTKIGTLSKLQVRNKMKQLRNRNKH